MPKCLYCLKQNDDYAEECVACHKPLRASNAKPAKTAAKMRPTAPPIPRPVMPPNTPMGYAQSAQMQGNAPPQQPLQPAVGSYQQQYGDRPVQQQIHGQCCPLCNRADGMWERNKLLYDVPVCKKCSTDFANRRAIAYIIDGIAWNFFPGFFLGVLSPFLPGGIVFLMATFLSIFGFLFKDGFKGKSMGKTLMGLMVLDSHTHEPIGFGQSAKRNLILYVPIIPIIVAFTLNKGMRLGDEWAETQVVWTKYLGQGPFWNVPSPDMQSAQNQAYSSRLGQV